MSKKFAFLKDVKEPEAKPVAPAKPKGAKTRKVRSGRPVGRPVKGKRSDPEFEPTTLYMKRATKKAVRMRLLEEGGERELSDVVEELVSDWVGKKAKP